MKKYTDKIIGFIKAHKIISSIVLLVLLFVGYKIFFPNTQKAETFLVKKENVVQKVIVNGKTKAVRDSSLSFEVNGIVKTSNVQIGSRVVAGQALVSLDQGQLYADLLKAKANVESEKARLDELKGGTRPEEISIAETEVANSKVTLEDAERNVRDKVVDIINNNVDQLFSNPRTVNPQLNLVLTDLQLKNTINSGRVLMETIINNWKPEEIDQNISKVSTFLDNIALAVNVQTQNTTFSQTTLDGYKSAISGAKSTFITSRESLNSARSALTLAEKNLSLKKSGSAPEVIRAQEAKVMQNEAQVQSVEVQLQKMTLRSPQSGIVTKQDAKVGEIVTPGKVVITVISDNDLEIESNVSEISVGKVSVGDPVTITFDAFPGETFEGSVTYIEPGETIIDGVVNYKVTVAFSKSYPQVKSGLTSKLEVMTEVKNQVLVVPQYAITVRDGVSYVSKVNGKETTEVAVTTGLKGQDGLVEILGGLNEGDVVSMLSQAK
ncbi:MAG: efflux RND transporter periplasmic adaptor subunit [Parcubacteria group bacterium]